MNETTNSPINPTASEEVNLQGIELGQQGKMPEAAQCFQKAISLNPGNITAYSNLGVILAHYGQFAEARQCFAQAIALDPNNAIALTNDALLLLLHCQFAEGWQKYEARPCLKNGGELKNLWDGSPNPNQILLIIHEQGSGDTIQFIRYLPIIRERCGKLIFLCPPSMTSLLNGFPGVDVLIDNIGSGVECHASIELMGLPRIVNTTLETIPANVPYLSASPEKAGFWKKNIVKDKLNVGLAWAGNPRNVVDWKRSLHLSDFAPLANPGVVFHSLQVAHRAEEAEHPPEGMKIENPAKNFADFSDTAAMIENLDIVIAVDTAVAHLAGAMGKPVWILLPFSPDWRWMLNREDSPWYPTARLFRQPQPENWAAVIQRVADELNRLVLQKASELRRQAAACLKEKKPDDALALAEAAISFRPDYADAHFIRGYALQYLGDMRAAEDSFRQVISLKPDLAEAHFGLGTALQNRGNAEEAIECYQRVIALNPKYINAYHNLGNLFSHHGDIGKAREYYAQALALDPGDTLALTFDGIALLLQGNLAEGWQKYEHWQSIMNKNGFPNRWDGSAIPDQILLVHYQGGFGDTLHFVRYLPLIRKRCGKLIFVCQPELIPLINNFPGIDILTDKSDSVKYHTAVGLLSLPGILNTTLETIPADIPYLSACPEKAGLRKKTIVKDKLNVGLVWAGNPKDVIDRKRSLHLCDFMPLAHPGVVFHSLQVGERAEEADQPPMGMRLENPAKDISDFSDTAAIIENLDLVISVDTAVVHLAGAMGKPVWILLPFYPDWRWMLNREDSPWYPTARLFRQPQPEENWAVVIQRVADELNRLVLQKASELRRQAAACLRENKRKDALALAEAAISFRPDYPDAHFIRGYVLQSLGNMTSAEESFRLVVSAKPELAEAHYGLGVSLQHQGKYKEAIEYYRQAVALNPKYVSAYNNLGNLLSHYGQFEKARECFAHIRAIDPDKTITLAYEALSLLLEGNFSEGWKKYEFRPSRYKTMIRKKWDGSAMPDQTIMVLHEQGFGDTIQFIRYLPIVKSYCKKLVFVCQTQLKSLISDFPGIDVLMDNSVTAEAQCHAAIELLSIPGVFNTNSENIPNKVPYLFASAEKTAVWKNIIAKDKLNVGLVWSGNSDNFGDWERSLHLCDFAPLANPGVVFHSLQVGHRAEEAGQPPEGMSLENPAKNISDFSDTAAIIENLDLVISVDTAVAHLAGAMGKPVWILLPFTPDWRWMLNREDSPWYPTARLFRQSQPDVWTDVIQRVADELRRLVSNRIFKRGFALHSQHNTEEAIECYQQVIAVNPKHAIACNNLGFIYLQNGEFAKATECFAHALEIDPNYGSALFNQSLILLLEGNFKEGWQKYEYRPSLDKDILQKKWDGSPIKTLLAVYEQGMGDSIQFMRYLPIIGQRCEKLIFICHADLMPLINFSGIEVLANDQARTIQCDAVIQLLSIPSLLNTGLETIPSDIPYISAEPEKAARWKSMMIPDKINVGLVWAGNPNHLGDARRSLHLSDFAPLAHPGVVFHSLQVEHRAEEANQPPPGMQLENPAKNIVDFSDTAAIIENSDLVISVDTAVAHLAGAMGKPVWILLPFSPDWRWMLNREDSPWYPTARLFRQSQPNVWTDVIQRVAGELNHLAVHRASELYRASMNLIRENKPGDALALIDKAISFKPDYPDAVFNRGYIFKLMGNHKASEESFRRFIELKPDHAEAYLGIGLALQEQGKPKDAEEYYRHALALNPNHTEAYLALGNALKDIGRADEAIESYQQTLRINPNHVEGWKGFGMALKEQGKMQQALTCYEKALSIEPKNIETWISIGNLKKAMGDISGSIETYRQTIQLKSDEGRVHSFLALALLVRGDFDEGWKEYEWRWEIEPLSAVKRHYSAPRWSGEPLNGKRIFLYGEQGFGDILQFVRYALILKNMGARIFLECYQELLPLVSRMSAIDAVVVPNHPIPAFDYHCPLMSLPYIFKTNLNSIPTNVPYLSACPEKTAHWQKKLCTLHFALCALKVGIVWAGNPSHKKDRERSIPLCKLAPILKTPGVQFFSLQVGGRAKDIQESCAFGDIVDLSPELKDFDDTAAVMSALDLIISVDTASAHLAGALGRPVWIMLQFSPDFRWLWGREDSPWYPSARLFRQPEHNCWEPVIRQIASELTDLTPQSLA